MKKHKWLAAFAIIAILAVIGYITVRHLQPEYAYMPPKEKVISKEKRFHGYDLWGTFTSDKPASAGKGAVKVDDRLLDLGRETFYKETFGNEMF
ncbi:electron transport protein, partial [Bacillus haynesii]|nr:electron transport protein [Bacillus haynesii]